MNLFSRSSAAILGVSLIVGLASLGVLLAGAVHDFKQYERSVRVKGLSEREYKADIVIWPIQYTLASNQLGALYDQLEANAAAVSRFLLENGITAQEITRAAPVIIDKSAQQYGGGGRAEFRYTASQSVTVYSTKVDAVRELMGQVSQLGKQGIVLTGGDYQSQTEYLFTRLNEVKPVMIEEATTKAREVALKFAADSQSVLGKIKRASQGQFSISDRDRNNPHIKRLRVVSTVEYYLSD